MNVEPCSETPVALNDIHDIDTPVLFQEQLGLIYVQLERLDNIYDRLNCRLSHFTIPIPIDENDCCSEPADKLTPVYIENLQTLYQNLYSSVERFKSLENSLCL